MTIWHHKHNILLIIICFYHPGAPLQTRDLSSRHCKNSLEMCLERLRWVSGYILALIAKEHTVKHLNNIFTDVQLDATEQNWSPRLKMFAAALQWWKKVTIHHTYGRRVGWTPVPATTLYALRRSWWAHPVLLPPRLQFSTRTWAAGMEKAVRVREQKPSERNIPSLSIFR